MIIGCYTLDLYCDADAEHAWRAFPVQFSAETGEECRQQARRAGWKLTPKTGTAVCPDCVRAGRTAKKEEPE
jgi:hypothetical protein